MRIARVRFLHPGFSFVHSIEQASIAKKCNIQFQGKPPRHLTTKPAVANQWLQCRPTKLKLLVVFAVPMNNRATP